MHHVISKAACSELTRVAALISLYENVIRRGGGLGESSMNVTRRLCSVSKGWPGRTKVNRRMLCKQGCRVALTNEFIATVRNVIMRESPIMNHRAVFNIALYGAPGNSDAV